MTNSFRYKLSGLAYWMECANPFTRTIVARNLPLGLRLHTYKLDAVGRGLYKRGIHEPALTEFLLATFGDGALHNFIDVGANIGYFSSLFSRLAGPSGRVLAIEPEPQNLDLLRRNVEMNHLANVEVLPCALGAQEGAAELGLYKSANRGRHSLVESEGRATVEVPVRRLDDVTSKPAPDVQSWSLVKIDVEGYEGFVLQGAPETLTRTENLVMEYSPEYLRKSGVQPEAIFEILTPHFSRIFQIQESGLKEVSVAECLESPTQVDLLFRR